MRVTTLIKTAALAAIPFIMFAESANSETTNPQIEMYLETPAQNETLTGVAFVRGWAVAPSGIDRIELYIDGVFTTNIPIGESRTAVGDLYPSYPDSNNSGFNMAFQYSKLTAGSHTATVRAIDANGQYKESFADFYIARFDTNQSNNFIRDPSVVSITNATVSNNGDSIRVQGINVDGVSYDINIGWSTLLQGFAVKDIENKTSGDFIGNKAKTESLIGTWDFYYTIISDNSERYSLTGPATKSEDSDNYVVAGSDKYGNAISASYDSKSNQYVLLDKGSLADEFFVFDFSGLNQVQGCYYIVHNGNDFSKCFAMTGVLANTGAQASSNYQSPPMTNAESQDQLETKLYEQNIIMDALTISPESRYGSSNAFGKKAIDEKSKIELYKFLKSEMSGDPQSEE